MPEKGKTYVVGNGVKDFGAEGTEVSKKEFAKIKAITQQNNLYGQLYTDALNKRAESVKQNENNLIKMIYQTPPGMHDYMTGLRGLDLHQDEYKNYIKQGILKGGFEASNLDKYLFRHKFHGVTLPDIEKMSPDPKTKRLAPTDIQKISKVFQASWVNNMLNKEDIQHRAISYLTQLAVEPLVYPDIPTPVGLKQVDQMRKNVTEFLAYFNQFYTNRSLPPSQETDFMWIFVKNSSRLPHTLATFLPAYLQITPSSATKLFRQRELLSESRSDTFMWKNVGDKFSKFFQDTYRPDAFPDDLAKYMHFDAEKDKKAALQMKPIIAKTVTPERQFAIQEEAKEITTKIDRTRKDLNRLIMQSPTKRVEFDMKQTGLAETAIMFKNQETTVIVLKLADDVHVTLELNKQGHFFGVPPELMKAFPHANEYMLTTLLNTILPKPIELVKEKPLQKSPQPIQSETSKLGNEIISEEEEIQEEKQLKRKHLSKEITIFKEDPLPPVIERQDFPSRLVNYTEDQVKQTMWDQGIKQEKILDEVLADIRGFENGHVKGVIVKEHKGKIIRIRSGKYRVFFERLGESKYKLVDIKQRKTSYTGEH